MSTCYCHSGKSFEDCCRPLLENERGAETPEQLMRSRYSAFCTKNLEYVIETTDPQARHDMDREGTKAWMDGAEFTKLEVLNSSFEGNKGTVEFKAYFKMADAPAEIHHEISKFRKQGGVWFFRDGKVIPPPAKV